MENTSKIQKKTANQNEIKHETENEQLKNGSQIQKHKCNSKRIQTQKQNWQQWKTPAKSKRKTANQNEIKHETNNNMNARGAQRTNKSQMCIRFCCGCAVCALGLLLCVFFFPSGPFVGLGIFERLRRSHFEACLG